jgi:DNA-binding PucR family transcriptional regulator
MGVGEDADWIAGFARRGQRPAELERLVRGIDAQIIDQVPEYAADEELRQDLHASTRAHWRNFLAVVTRDVFEVQVPPEVFDLARTLARRGLDLAVLLKTYRVGQQALWTHITRLLENEVADPELRSAALVRFWGRASRWLDTSMELLVGTYSAEREQWQRGALARRVETVHAVLRGEPFDCDEASALLRHPLRQHHTAIVLWAEENTDVVGALEGSAAALAGALGAGVPLSIGSGARGLWCWVATPGLADLGRLDEALLRPGVRAAIGATACGLDGFRRSHREALAAQAVAITSSRQPALTRYGDVELACLAAGLGDVDALRTMIQRELGALAAADPATVRLRETVRLFLANAGNADATGQDLSLHRNTVRYRIHQAEQLIGHPVDQRRMYLELALHCVEVYGADALIP